MATFAPTMVCTPYHLEIAQDHRGRWVVRDNDGLIGGVFVTQKDAIRFALFEANGDSTHVRLASAVAAGASARAAPRRRSLSS